MEYRSFYLIQTYKKCNRSNMTDVSRFISGNYMGAAEFEFGAIPRAFDFFKNNEIGLYTVNFVVKDETVGFYAITTPLGLERFKQEIPKHLSSNRPYLKEPTYIREMVLSPESVGEYNRVDLWMVVDGFSTNMSVLGGDRHPSIFTLDFELAKQTYLYLLGCKRDLTSFREHLKLGDEVITHKNKSTSKIVGLNNDNTVSVKEKYGKARKIHIGDVYPTDIYDSVVNEKASL